MTAHTCHAVGCKRVCKPEHLMCWPHWRTVNRYLQARVWNAYRPGQCDDKSPSEEWHDAADAAIGWVARAEGRPLTPAQAAALDRAFPRAKLPPSVAALLALTAGIYR